MFSVKRLISSLIFKVRFRKGPNQFFRQITKDLKRWIETRLPQQHMWCRGTRRRALTYPQAALTSPT